MTIEIVTSRDYYILDSNSMILTDLIFIDFRTPVFICSHLWSYLSAPACYSNVQQPDPESYRPSEKV